MKYINKLNNVIPDNKTDTEYQKDVANLLNNLFGIDNYFKITSYNEIEASCCANSEFTCLFAALTIAANKTAFFCFYGSRSNGIFFKKANSSWKEIYNLIRCVTKDATLTLS